MRFGDKILILMTRKGINQERLAALSGKSQSTVSGWINGAKPHKSTVLRLAEIFTTNYDCLMNDEVELPNWEPPEKVKGAYPPEFSKHLGDLRENSEEYQSGQNNFELKVLSSLQRIESMLSTLVGQKDA